METMKASLRQHPFLADLDEEIIDKLVGISERKTLAENTLLFKQGDNADQFYLVDKGLITVGFDPKLHSQVNIQSVTDGEVLGWSWLIPPYRWQFDARTVEETRVIILDAVKLRQMFEARQDIGYIFSRRILQIVAKRLLATRIQFWDIYKMHYMLEHNSM